MCEELLTMREIQGVIRDLRAIVEARPAESVLAPISVVGNDHTTINIYASDAQVDVPGAQGAPPGPARTP